MRTRDALELLLEVALRVMAFALIVGFLYGVVLLIADLAGYG